MRTPNRVAALIGVAALALATTSCSSSGGDGSAASSQSASSARPSESSAPPLSLVAVGDSLAYNSPDDCPGCTGFVDSYAEALANATGKEVTTSNLSQHNSLTLPMLMDELEPWMRSLPGHQTFPPGSATFGCGAANLRIERWHGGPKGGGSTLGADG